MFPHKPRFNAALAACLIAVAAQPLTTHAAEEKKTAAPKPALTVTAVQPQSTVLPLRVTANGNIAAWQEAVVGTEANGLRLTEVLVNIGDAVKRGQVLAVFTADTVNSDLAEARATVADAHARYAEASANAHRAKELYAQGFFSQQKVIEALTQESSARARLNAQRATLNSRSIRVSQAKVMAPDDGFVSSRTATVGAVMPAGQELFRIIRQGRLEWRAEVPASEMAAIKSGTPALVTPAGGSAIKGSVRILAPTVDPQTRNGIVYVDLPEPGSARSGMFARGEFEVGSSTALTLPQGAVQLREGFSYVLRIGADSKVTQTKINIGRRAGDRIEILGGIDATAKVVAAGGAFIGDGDTVKVVEAPTAKPVAPASQQAK